MGRLDRFLDAFVGLAVGGFWLSLAVLVLAFAYALVQKVCY